MTLLILEIKVLLKELWSNTITAVFFRFSDIPIPLYSKPEKIQYIF